MNIVPKPFRTEISEGSFLLRSDIEVNVDLPVIANMFGGFSSSSSVTFRKEKTDWDYEIVVSRSGVVATASDDEGLFHAAVTLKQLIGGKRETELPACRIYDKPRYAYRAAMIDVCRHFFGVETVKKLIDTMAMFKFNYLHFHVSDDQGFRLRIDSMPKLHRVGSVRKGTCGDGVPHGGYYTKAQIAEIVSYAAERFIRIIPEIDIPGHTRAILAAYPELSCSGKHTDVATWFGIHSKVLCAGKEEVYQALDKIFAEAAEMFPCEYFHLGGDEVAKLEWSKCPACLETMKREGLEDMEQLQGYFTNRAIELLEKYGKTPILWNEALKSDMLDKRASVQYWTTDKASAERVARAVKEEGRKVIFSRCNPYYLDYPSGMHSLKAIYTAEPEQIPGSSAKSGIMGVECPLWTEHISKEKDLFEHFYPRAIAVAERGWSAQENDYADFEERLENVLFLLSEKDVPYLPVKKSNPVKAVGALQAAAFGMKAQRRADITSARNWRSTRWRKPRGMK